VPGKNLNKLTTVDLGIVNEFHIRGRKATMELGKKMNLSARSLGKLQRPLLKADMLAASTRPFPTRRAKPHGTGPRISRVAWQRWAAIRQTRESRSCKTGALRRMGSQTESERKKLGMT
jgi:hypothetical protein